MSIVEYFQLNSRQVAIIIILTPEIEKKKFPKLFCWNYFWKVFRKQKLYFQKNIYGRGTIRGLPRPLCLKSTIYHKEWV